jgi:hypothetical protein
MTAAGVSAGKTRTAAAALVLATDFAGAPPGLATCDTVTHGPQIGVIFRF